MNYILNTTGLEQRLIQIFAYSIGTTFLHELMYTGMFYAFYNSVSLNLENIKGNFFMSNLIQYKNLINIRPLFETTLSCEYKIIKYDSLLFRKFYNIINKINPILNILNFIINIGARSNKNQYQQIVGIRGFLNTSRSYITKFPLIKNFERGLNLVEYIMSSYGVRKGLLDTSIQTAESGYLTRRLIEVVHDIVIKEKDCNSYMYLILRKYNSIQGFLKLPSPSIVSKKYIYYNITKPTEFYIKSPILCFSGRSFCNKCLGFSYNIGSIAGESIGIIAGESLGEPSTQLTLRTFHTGGVLSHTNEQSLYNFKINSYICFNRPNKLVYFMFTKNTAKNNIFKYITKKKIVFKHLNNLYYKQLFGNLTNNISYFLSLYKFNNFIKYPVEKSLIKYHYMGLNKYNIFLNLINLYSLYSAKKNTINEWVFIYLTNSLNYLLKNSIHILCYGGFYLTNIKNLTKFNIIYSYTKIK